MSRASDQPLDGASARGWSRFHQLHLHDYGPAATRLWLAIVAAGTVAIGLALSSVVALPPGEVWQMLGWTAVAVTAAAFPIQIPRTKHSIATGDVVLFLLLALHGVAAAVLAAALEAFTASARTSTRLSSRLASLAAAAVAMTAAGLAFGALLPWLQASGLPHAAAQLVALAAAALIHYVACTLSLTWVVHLKRGMPLTLATWYASTSWVGTLYLLSATMAGMLALHAQQFGRLAVAVGVLVIGLSLALLRTHFRQLIAEHDAQEARVDAAQREAEQNQKRFHAAFTEASIGMAIVDADGIVLQANQALSLLLGYAAADLCRRSFSQMLHPGDADLLDRHIAGVLGRADETTFSIELRCIGSDRRETWVSLHCARFDNHAGTKGGLILQLHDISSRRRAEGQLHHVAYHDSLTDLANRGCFQERLAVAVERSRTEREAGFAVMILDIDRFKLVNDSLGHVAGDELLKAVAHRLSDAVRPRDLVARLGGDEFAILLEESHRPEAATRLGERLLKALQQPISINGTELRPTASIGLTFSDYGYREPDEIVRDADLAMYKAKADGKGRLVLFDASLHQQLGDKLQLEADLRRAIGEGSLSLAYQPLYDLDPHRLIGFEALARWVHPQRGTVSPGVFIALAEETGCIHALTAWAIEEAVKRLAEWRNGSPPHADLVMHVNVSGRDLAQPNFVPHVREVLQRHDLPAKLLTLELTESALMEHRETAMLALAELRAIGVKLGIDDFGTGYSSLAYLSVLPFDCLKIDRSFVIGMAKSRQNVEIVRTILSLGRTLNKQVVAEGIETRDQLLRLRELGAPVGQGYLLSRPLDPAAVRELLADPLLALP